MTKKKEKFVLAFYPNALGFGFAFMENAITVKDSQIVVSRPMNNKYMLNRIYDYIDYYEPDVVVLENYNGRQSRKSKRVQKLIDSISTHARNKGIKTSHHSREEIRFVFSNFKAKTKYEIASVISDNVKGLNEKKLKKRKFYESENYKGGIFDAVSLGITYYYLNE